MDSSGAEEWRELVSAPGAVTDKEIGEEAEGQDVVEPIEAGDGERLLADREKENQRKEQEEEKQCGAEELQEEERVAKERQDNLQVADHAVFGGTELELKVHDERERLLAATYRDQEKQRKDRAQARRERDGNNIYKPVQSDLDTNDDESCYIEIKNLVLIEKSVIHKKALEEWDRKEKLFASRVERKTNKVGNLKNEVYQLIGLFSVFQGVVLTAVSQSNLLHCNNRWSPILLSVLASIVTIAGVAQKLLQISSLEYTIYSENQALKVCVAIALNFLHVAKRLMCVHRLVN